MKSVSTGGRVVAATLAICLGTLIALSSDPVRKRLQANRIAAQETVVIASEQAVWSAAERARVDAVEKARKSAAEAAERRAAADKARQNALEEARKNAADEARKRAAEEASRIAAEQARQNALDEARTVTGGEARKIRPPRGLVTYKMIIARHARAQGVPFDLAKAIVWQESRYKAQAIGSSGERGLMQIMPATARGLGYRGKTAGLHDPEVNIGLGMKYLAKAYRMANGDICQTVLRYNAGLGAKQMTANAAKYCAKVKRYLRIPEPIPMNMP